MNQHYEFIFIISSKVEDSAHESVVKQMQDLIKNQGGSITKQENMGRKKFGYEIAHEAQGTYVLLEFDMETENLKKLEAGIKLVPGVLRHLIVKKRVKTEREVAREKKIQEKIDQAQAREFEQAKKETQKKEAPTVVVEKKSKLPKISLEDLDKKLDEILKEDV
ncbi:MAG: 30S ribosomal protein S6 [Patescibacteria group bacterium]|jgi:small subunit ribosomal protein S6